MLLTFALRCGPARPLLTFAWALLPMIASAQSADACIPPLTYLPLNPAVVGADDNGMAALGSYERVSPDGRFILRSYSGAKLGKVSLMELPAMGEGAVKAYRTPFSNEAFPVQGTWRYLVDVTGEHYRFADVLNKQTEARPLFRAGMTGFYAAASEMGIPTGRGAMPPVTQGAPGSIYIRSLSWPQNADADNQGTGPLQIATTEVKDDGRTAPVVGVTGPQFICQGRQAVDGGVYALPMISVDGTEFSAVPQMPSAGQPSMRVYGLSTGTASKQHPCDLRVDMGLSPSKVIFGFPGHGAEQTWLTYSDLGYVYVFDRVQRQTFRLDHGRYRVLASAFPGMTRDGRVIYGATWRDCPDTAQCPERSGYVVVDPYQSQAYRAYWSSRQQPPPKACITQRDVESERADFARFHGLNP
ncbi:MAG: hypothetical protein WBC18_14565 [Ottowia sp.]|uniref:hypothetical protein n=1 Tax=Ottowia sp. TaxID=1898956 RepID=UPI003C727067